MTDFWQRIGVGVEPVVVPIARQRDREYMATFPGLVLKRFGSDVRLLKDLHSSRVPLPENDFVGAHATRYINPEFDGLLERYSMTIPKQERIDVLGQIVRHVAGQLTVMGLFFDGAPIVIGNRLQHVTSAHALSTPASNAHEWDLR